MYLHPWDVVDEGPRSVLERISSAGIGAVNLAVSYHSARFVLPHNPKHKVYFAEEGVVYFEPNTSYYKNTILKPRRSSEYGGKDVLALVLKEAKDFRMKVNAWTVTFHNSAFARAHPDLAIIDVFEEKNYNYICPNNSESRKYHSALVRNLLDYDLNTIQLESSCYPAALQHGDHHENLGTQIEPVVSELMTFCFCEHCVKSAKKSGLDLRKSRKLVREAVETSFNMPTNVLVTTPVAETIRTAYVLSSDIDELREIQSFQRDAVSDLFSETRAVIKDAESKVKLNAIAFGGFSGMPAVGRGTESLNLRSLGKIVDGINLVTYMSEADLVYYITKWVKFDAGDCPLYIALRPGFPAISTDVSLAAAVRNAIEAGASGVEFYNYGWTHLRNFEWIKEALKSSPSPSLPSRGS